MGEVCEVKVGEAVSIRMKAILETRNKAVYRLTREIAMPYETMKSIMYGKTDGVNLKNVLLIKKNFGNQKKFGKVVAKKPLNLATY